MKNLWYDFIFWVGGTGFEIDLKGNDKEMQKYNLLIPFHFYLKKNELLK